MSRFAEQLRAQLQGLFAFPVTPFTETGEVDLPRYRDHLHYLIDSKPAALFVCGGTGEFFSLDPCEYRALVKVAVEVSAGRLPVVAGAGYGAKLATGFVKAAEEEGADGILLMPPYLLEPEQEGLYQHYRSIAESTRQGIIFYQRDNAIFTPSTVRRLAEIPNIIGFKDGHGDMERLTRIRLAVAERLVFINGMPTAELSSTAFFGVGICNYSSAVFNFVPEISQAFFRSLRGGDSQRLTRLLEAFYLPFAELRDRKKGYAVSLIKAGLKVLGRPVGRARPPLVSPTPEEEAQLKVIIENGLSALGV
jgi:5-dehydro-4-deoxyglucarate dehydratase